MGQIVALLAFSIGVFTPNYLTEVPALLPLMLAAAVLCVLCYRLRQFWLISFLIGLVFATYQANARLTALLPETLNNQTLILEGKIVGIPQRTERSWRFDFIPSAWRATSAEQSLASVVNWDATNRLRLSYYGFTEQPFVNGEQLSIEVKLRRPHGLINEGLFDYRQWLLGKGYSATGYIKAIKVRGGISRDVLGTLDHWRAQITQTLASLDIRQYGAQAALLVGDKRFLSADNWALFVNTGTVHLMVISGLHVGFVAGLGWFFGRWILSLLAPWLGLNAVRWANLSAIVFALGYSAAAGFSIPTQRALIMITAILLPRLLYLKTSRWWGLSLALALVAIIQPMATLQTGFWLSFGAVVLIFIGLGDSDKQTAPRSNFLLALVRIQLLFLVGFSAMLVAIQGQFNLISFPANLIAVPITSLLLVPLEIIGLISYPLYAPLSLFIWSLCGYVIDWQLAILTWLVELPSWRLIKTDIASGLVLLAVIAGFGLVAVRRWWQKILAIGCMLPLFWSFQAPKYSLEVRVFDVGQGTAILVRQPNYSLLYDTGSRFSEQFDSGADIIAPSLERLRINRLDTLVISHPDADHIGGYAGLVEQIAIDQLWLGRQPEGGQSLDADECGAGINWQIGEVSYQFIYPLQTDPGVQSVKNNDRSCVLKIRFADQQILIAGDIGKRAEAELLASAAIDSANTLLFAPHHGSKNSSSRAFVQAVAPQYVVFNAGYLNRFGHPHPSVVERYRQVGANTYNTAEDGMIQFIWNDLQRPPQVKRVAQSRRFWWQQ